MRKKCMLFWKLAKSLTQPRLTRVLWPTFSNPRLSSLWTLSGLCVPALADSPYIFLLLELLSADGQRPQGEKLQSKVRPGNCPSRAMRSTQAARVCEKTIFHRKCGNVAGMEAIAGLVLLTGQDQFVLRTQSIFALSPPPATKIDSSIADLRRASGLVLASKLQEPLR